MTVKLYLGIEETRRISAGLVASAGALLFAAFGLIGAGVSGKDLVYAASVSQSVPPLASGLVLAILALASAEIASNDSMPSRSGRFSADNLLKTAFALMAVSVPLQLGFGLYQLVTHAMVAPPT